MREFASLGETGPCDVAPQESLCLIPSTSLHHPVHLIHITEAGEHPLCILIHLWDSGATFHAESYQLPGDPATQWQPTLARDNIQWRCLWTHDETTLRPRSESCRGSRDFSLGLPTTPRHLLEDYNEKENKLMCSTVASRVTILRTCFPWATASHPKDTVSSNFSNKTHHFCLRKLPHDVAPPQSIYWLNLTLT